MASIVESHPERSKIDAAILAGTPIREIGASVTPKLSHMAIQRYKNGLVRPQLAKEAALAKILTGKKFADDSAIAAAVTNGTLAALRAAPAVDPYLARLAKHQETLDEAVSAACQDEDYKAVANLIGTDLKGMELSARLEHRLDGSQGNNGTSIYIMTPAVTIQASQAQSAEAAGDDSVIIDIAKR